MIRFIILTIFMCSSLMAGAQHPYYYTIHDDNGLPSNEVYQLQQDEFGYMWIGCNAGLFRYDGFKFQAFKNVLQNAVAISGLKKSGNRLYCQNFSGQLFYEYNDSLVLFADVKDRTRFHPSFTTDKDNNVWIGMPEGLLKCDPAGHQEILFKEQLAISEIELSDDGSLYAIDISKGLLKIYKDDKGKYNWRKIYGVPEAFTASRTTIEKYKNRIFTLSSTNMTRNYFITEIRSDTARLIRQIPAKTLAEFIYTITLIDDKLWLGTSSGVYRMDMQGVIDKHLFPTEKISDIITDREGNYWFSSLQNGIFVVPELDLMTINTTNSLLKDNNITALKCISPNNLLIGTYSGDIYNYSLKDGKTELLPKSREAVYRNVTSIIPYGKNTIVAARGTVSGINLTTKKDYSHISVYIRDMIQRGDSVLFVSSEEIGVMTPLANIANGGKFRVAGIKNVSGKKICYDETGKTIWVSLNTGLAAFEQNNFTPFTINNAPLFCNELYADSAGLWVGTVSDGVYNIRNKKPRLHLDHSNGLRGNNVRSIISQKNVLYIATDDCINVYQADGSFTYIDQTDGINAKEITSLSFSDGFLFIGTIRGLFYLNVNSPFTNNVRPYISITSVYANGIKKAQNAPVDLTWNSKDILINFSSVALRSRGRFAYYYRINGFQNEWKKLDGSINYVRLSHLPAGNFTFEVRSANEDGIISKDTATLSIAVHAPFWQRWWFYWLITTAAATIVAFLFILRIRKIKQNAHIRNQITSSQLTALKAQMNPHFMYNTLNSIQDLILQNDIKSTNYYLSRYSTLMRKILQSSESNEIELNEEIEILELYMELEKLRFGDDLIYTLQVVAPNDRNNSSIPSMIIQPFVENAIKHGLLHKKGIKKLDIIFEQREEVLICTIKDNGVGRKTAMEIKSRSPLGHQSFATKATERRLELINLNREQKIRLEIMDLEENGKGTGTEVRLYIPLIQIDQPAR